MKIKTTSEAWCIASCTQQIMMLLLSGLIHTHNMAIIRLIAGGSKETDIEISQRSV